MSQSIRKKRTSLALVTMSEPMAQGESLPRSYTLDRSFYGWLADSGPRRAEHYYRPLTTDDFVQVELATVREGKAHRHWPREVVEKFLAAEIIGR